MGRDEVQTAIDTWEEVLTRAKSKLFLWRRRDLTLKGRVLVVNTLFLSKLWYVFATVCLPTHVLRMMRKMVREFLWKGKPSKIAYDTLVAPQHEGSLGLFDPLLRMNALRIRTARNFMAVGMEDWKKSMSFFLDRNFKMGLLIFLMARNSDMMSGIPMFYQEVLGAWRGFVEKVCCVPATRREVMQQPLFLNPKLRIEPRVHFLHTWFKAGFRKVGDLFYEVIPGLLPLQAFMDELRAMGG